MDQSERLDQIEKISQNARSTWFGLLVVLLFVGITLMGHKDSDFFAFGASTTLPVVNVQVPPTSFFLAAPVLTAALYCYLQVYLLGLWDALGQIEQEPGAPPIGDRVYPTIYTVAGLLYRDYRRGDHSMPPRDLSRLTVVIAILLGWVFGLVVLAWLWWRSAPAHDPAITLLAGLSFWSALMAAIISLLAARGHLAGLSRTQIAGRSILRQAIGVVLLAVIAVLSYDRAGGGLIPLKGNLVWTEVIPGLSLPTEIEAGDLPLLMARADMPQAELTVRPGDWLPYDEWLKEYRATYGQREGLAPPFDSWTPTQKSAFMTESWVRWRGLTQSLDPPNLADQDLRGAWAKTAFLAGADLRGAQMQEAALVGAEMQGADLGKAQMNGANLGYAQMQGANLKQAQMQGANLKQAQMKEAYLKGAQMNGANLQWAQLQGANLERAQMQGANLWRAQMQGANLGGAKMQGANLWRAQMQGANLGGAKMKDAVLTGAQMQGTNLERAWMQGANLNSADMQGASLRGATMLGTNCTFTNFDAALVQSADLTCSGGIPDQMELAWTVGDADTALPFGRWVWSCLARDDPHVMSKRAKIDTVLAHHPATSPDMFRISRAGFERVLFCDDDEPMRPIGDLASKWPFWRWWARQLATR